MTAQYEAATQGTTAARELLAKWRAAGAVVVSPFSLPDLAGGYTALGGVYCYTSNLRVAAYLQGANGVRYVALHVPESKI